MKYDFRSRNSDFHLSGIVISYRRTGDGKCPGILISSPMFPSHALLTDCYGVAEASVQQVRDIVPMVQSRFNFA